MAVPLVVGLAAGMLLTDFADLGGGASGFFGRTLLFAKMLTGARLRIRGTGRLAAPGSDNGWPGGALMIAVARCLMIQSWPVLRRKGMDDGGGSLDGLLEQAVFFDSEYEKARAVPDEEVTGSATARKDWR